MSAPLSALVVEDVPLATAKLVRLLDAHADIRVDATARSVAEADALLKARRFDLLLLDIQLPDGDGLALAARWPAMATRTIFITAHHQHALRSYALGAADYLLKPVDADRLAMALDRMRRLIAPPPPPASPGQWLAVKQGSRTEFLDPARIDYIDMAGHYACVHVGAQVHLLRESIMVLAAQLAGAGVLRVHRSVLVNPQRVRALHERRNGDAMLELAGGEQLPLSRTYRNALEEALRVR
ncbi:LytTR family DNA-binding domain-containing protein [Stenotrophomonas sp.]|uniref:LytR/AlgR family response regulator transcription factor n=1 Tax=Stenotrophomonas sp. TaxID=69392 RepID=UPI0028AE16DF|nr:LytTR family DNA-binding domain-containing protein [Stenotrophomonas sp.]